MPKASTHSISRISSAKEAFSSTTLSSEDMGWKDGERTIELEV